MSAPRISAIVIADRDGDRSDEFRMMAALAAQDIPEPFEILLAENERNRLSFPEALQEIAPNTRVLFFPQETSSKLKDAALPFAGGSLVAVFEADSPPMPGWLRLLVETLDRRPDAQAISGRTVYGFENALKRSAGLIDRGYIETDGIDFTPFVSSNAALYRREVLEQFRYNEEENPFVAGQCRTEAMQQTPSRFLFHPGAISVHQFDGLTFLRDERRNQGLSDGRMKYLSRQRPFTWRDRLSLQIELARLRLSWDWKTCRKAARAFIYWYDWPLVLVLLFYYRWIEWPAVGYGLAGRENLPSTSYR